MKKIKFILSCILSMIIIGSVTFSVGFISAKAETLNYNLTSTDFSLVCPNSYEQYLNLVNPQSVAVCDKFTAIADGTKIYVFDKEKENYKAYDHGVNAITKLAFDENGSLYFITQSASNNLFKLDCSQDTLQAPTAYAVYASAFSLSNEYIYTVNISGSNCAIYKIPLNNIQSQATPLYSYVYDNENTAIPCISYYNGVLYFIKDSKLCKIDGEQTTIPNKKLTDENVADITINNDVLYFIETTLNGNNLVLLDLKTNNILSLPNGKYSALSYYNNMLYIISGKSVKEYDIAKNVFTSYEISASSDSVNRLNNATVTESYQNILAIADIGNNRITIYDTIKNSYKNIVSPIAPTIISLNDSEIMVSNGATAYLAKYTDKTPLFSQITISASISAINDIACVYDSFYIIADGTSFYKYSSSLVSNATHDLGSSARFITSDINGNLYVAFSQDNINYNVYKYSETALMTSGNQIPQTPYAKFNQSLTLLLISFDATLYALTPDGEILSSDGDGEIYTISSNGIVYNDSTKIKSFAFSFDSEFAYFCFGNYIAKTSKLNLSNTKNIPTNSIGDEIFSNQSSDSLELLQISSNSTLIGFDLSTLKDDEYFNYSSYYRNKKALNGVKLAEIGNYYIIALYNSNTRSYDSNLVLKESCEEIEANNYSKPVESVGYLTNDALLFRYPYINSDLTLFQLKKATQIYIISEINLNGALDYNYYYVSVETEGVTYKGYVAKTFVLNYSGITNSNFSISYSKINPTQAITFTAEDNTTISVDSSIEVIIYQQGENTSLVGISKDGKTYFATIENTLLQQSNDSVKYFIIAMIAILAILVVVCYVVLRKGVKRPF